MSVKVKRRCMMVLSLCAVLLYLPPGNAVLITGKYTFPTECYTPLIEESNIPVQNKLIGIGYDFILKRENSQELSEMLSRISALKIVADNPENEEGLKKVSYFCDQFNHYFPVVFCCLKVVENLWWIFGNPQIEKIRNDQIKESKKYIGLAKSYHEYAVEDDFMTNYRNYSATSD